LYQQTERALCGRFGEQQVRYVHASVARKLLSNSFVLDYV
jgi:hypothetical protein